MQNVQLLRSRSVWVKAHVMIMPQRVSFTACERD